jgi:hypothetical protein
MEAVNKLSYLFDGSSKQDIIFLFSMYLDNIKKQKKQLSHQLCKHVVKINVGQGIAWLIDSL